MRGCLHCNTNDGICSIPEANVSGILSALGRVPWHDEKVELDQNVKDDDNMPRLELRLGQVGLASAPADNIDTDSHG